MGIELLADPVTTTPVPSAPETRPRAMPVRRARLRRVLGHLPASYWAYFDLLLVAGLTGLAYRLIVLTQASAGWIAGPWLTGTAFAVCFMFSGLVFGLYEIRTLGARSLIVARSAMTAGLGLVLAHACIVLFFHGATTRWLGLLVAVLYCAVALPVRLVAHEAITDTRRRVLCIGNGDSIRKAVTLVGRALHSYVNVIGHVAARDVVCDRTKFQPDADCDFEDVCPSLGSLCEIDAILTRQAIDEVVVGSELSGDAAVGQAVLACLEKRCRVTDQTTFVEKMLGEVPAENIDAEWFLVADVQGRGAYDTIKRLFDVLVALAGLMLTLPLWLLIALGIRLEGMGPVFFRQRRVGLHGREFTICKFRTMREDAEKHGAQWAAADDGRATRIGRILRLTRLDELPQLWNILRGDMSVVGPRPERPEFVERLTRLIPHYRQRHLIKPGLTGWAQIHLGYGATVEDARRKLRFDLYYLKHRAIELDCVILIRTLGTCLLGAR